MPRSLRVALALAVLPGIAAAADAQTVLLRFQPPVGLEAHVLWRFEIKSTLTDGADVPVANAEAVGTRSLTYRVMAQEEASRAVRVTRDSVRYEWRSAPRDWTGAASESGTPPTADLLVDDRLRVSLTSGPPAGHERAELGAFAGGFEAPLPEGPVGAGDSWTADVVMPAAEATGFEAEPDVGRWLARVDAMIARSTFSVDSLVDRGSDTLVYLRVRGSFLAASLVAALEAAEGRSRMDGDFAGQLIWSTGWHGYVSGAVRRTLRLQVLRGLPPDEEVSYGMTSDATLRFRIRR